MMKKKVFIIFVACVLLLSCVTASGCSTLFGNNNSTENGNGNQGTTIVTPEDGSSGDSGNTATVTVKSEPTQFLSASVNAEPVAPANGKLNILDSYTDGAKNYYLLDVGYAFAGAI